MLIIPILLSLSAYAADPTLKLTMNRKKQSFTVTQLGKKLEPQSISVVHPEFKREIHFEGYWLKDVLKLAGYEVPADPNADLGDLEFTCLDGYKPTLPIEKMEKLNLLVAVREKDVKGGWNKVPHGKAMVSPGPFFIVGTTEGSYAEFPWPYQVESIETVRFKERFPNVYPEGAAADSAALRGFRHFKSMCLSCHSVNLEGGTVGPELNIPKNITEYHDRDHLKAFIRDPSQFRARTPMMSFQKLSDSDLDDILEFLEHMKERKKMDRIQVKP